jgi:hypothetical protein
MRCLRVAEWRGARLGASLADARSVRARSRYKRPKTRISSWLATRANNARLGLAARLESNLMLPAVIAAGGSALSLKQTREGDGDGDDYESEWQAGDRWGMDAEVWCGGAAFVCR